MMSAPGRVYIHSLFFFFSLSLHPRVWLHNKLRCPWEWGGGNKSMT